MKIKTKNLSYADVQALPSLRHKSPRRPSRLLHLAMRLAAVPDLRETSFTYESVGMERAGRGPWLVLMNHCSFLDFEIASRILWPRPYSIVATSDGFVGKEGVMRALGCIPTCKFIPDATLVLDMKHALKVNKNHVLMYPEASYSFDGTTTPLPPRFSRLLRFLGVPVVMITTYGSFTRDPLYNNLQNRRVKVHAKVECLLTPEEIRTRSVEELEDVVRKAFDLDYFRWQAEHQVCTAEPFRADGLNRVLFRCCECGVEGAMVGKGTTLTCNACGRVFPMDELGRLAGGRFSHIPDWHRWEREQIRLSIQQGTYVVETPVRIGMMVDYKAIYFVGEGVLRHDHKGFELTGCDGQIHFVQSPRKCYSVYSDYNWYEIGDVVCIGNTRTLYYCFPDQPDVVAKLRIAVEELFKMEKGRVSHSAKTIADV